MKTFSYTTCRWRFKVKEAKETFLVDVRAHGCNGSCTCPEFVECAVHILGMGGAKDQNDTRCPHILAAREKFLERELQKMVRRSNASHLNLIKFEPKLKEAV